MTIQQKMLFTMIRQLDSDGASRAIEIISQMIPGEPPEPGDAEAHVEALNEREHGESVQLEELNFG